MSNFLHRVRFRRSHLWARDHMSAYLDGELASNARLKLERHVSECDECRGLLAGLRGMLDALYRLPAPSGGADALQVAASVRARLRLREPPASE
jgi:anti-sigma factor RsiW